MAELNSQKLHGHILTDLLDIENRGVYINERIRSAFKDVHAVMYMNSITLVEYLQTITIGRTKEKCRHFMRITIIYIVLWAYKLDGIIAEFPRTIVFGWLLLSLFVFLYMCTFRRLTRHHYYVICLLIFNVSHLITLIIELQNTNIYQLAEFQGIIINFTVFVFTPLPFIICFCHTIWYGLAYTLCIYDEYMPAKRMSESILHQTKYPLDDCNNLYSKGHKGHYKLIAQLLLWGWVFLLSIYLGVWNSLRHRAAFLRLGQAVEATSVLQESLTEQSNWIGAVMPAQVKEEYMDLRKRNADVSPKMWVYCRAFSNVSILFADIVGFTKMSSTKTANEVVLSLNDLFNRFDDLCTQVNCEKLGTLGDCYYCVSGCPIPRADHASCCVELGLGMCRIIRVFNREHNEEVNMRVGIHTGRVNAAIIGSQRFRYDVYGYDVIIANEIESSGKPGRVHISESTFQLIKMSYNVCQTADLLVKKEEMSGIAGMKLTTTPIKTYFVDQRSSFVRKKHERYGQNQGKFKVLASSNAEDSDDKSTEEKEPESESDDLEDTDSKEQKMHSRVAIKQMGMIKQVSTCWGQREELFSKRVQEISKSFQRDIKFITKIHNDPSRQTNLLHKLQLTPVTLRFTCPNTEWQYVQHTSNCIEPATIDCVKIAPMIDAWFGCFLLGVFISYVNSTRDTSNDTIADDINFPSLGIRIDKSLSMPSYNVPCFIAILIAVSISLILSWTSCNFACQLRPPWRARLCRSLSHPAAQEALYAIFSQLPLLILVVLLSLTNQEEFSNPKGRNSFFCQAILSLLFNSVFTASVAWARAICTLLSLFILLIVYAVKLGQRKSPTSNHDCKAETIDLKLVDDLTYITLQLVLATLVVVIVSRMSEHNCRLCFYVRRESHISADEAQRSVREGQDMVFNIIPHYVYSILTLHTSSKKNDENALAAEASGGGMNYAVSNSDVGVIFACISNFFSKYYREDYKGGESALKLLNNIICTFDESLNLTRFKDVEKIKTINDCYMVASGLNAKSVAKNADHRDHLVALMHYARLMQELLTNFNEEYIVGADKFEIKIGYNYGTVTAGIIGTTKPMYDIWGDTVNVASRMYSTGAPGLIQVPKYVCKTLKHVFDFEYRGKIFVKGKGDMNTYVCTGVKNKSKLGQNNME